MADTKKVESPSEKWARIQKKLLEDITEIDNETPWQERQPNWWTGMMAARKAILSHQSN